MTFIISCWPNLKIQILKQTTLLMIWSPIQCTLKSFWSCQTHWNTPARWDDPDWSQAGGKEREFSAGRGYVRLCDSDLYTQSASSIESLQENHSYTGTRHYQHAMYISQLTWPGPRAALCWRFTKIIQKNGCVYSITPHKALLTLGWTFMSALSWHQGL